MTEIHVMLDGHGRWQPKKVVTPRGCAEGKFNVPERCEVWLYTPPNTYMRQKDVIKILKCEGRPVVKHKYTRGGEQPPDYELGYLLRVCSKRGKLHRSAA
jgi:hypothetical protein